jgi:hypothetical protein
MQPEWPKSSFTEFYEVREVFVLWSRARRTGFYHGVGAFSLLGAGLMMRLLLAASFFTFLFSTKVHDAVLCFTKCYRC